MGIVIVGGGLAAAKAAEVARAEGYDDEIVLVGQEELRPYERPPLSKDYLTGNSEREKAFVHPEGWYAENDVTLRLGSAATKLDRDARQVELADGSRVGYDKLLLATGARPKRLPGDPPGVQYLRDFPHSDALREALGSGGRRVLILGAGWIGLEVAAAARGYGNEVDVVEPEPLPLRRALGDEVAQVFVGLHREHGVRLHLGARVQSLDPGGRHIQLSDGESIDADLILAGIGIQPNVDLAEDAGLTIDEDTGGIAADEHLRTDDPAIYVAGDCASAYLPLLGRRVRVEHWANALNQGKTAGAALAGRHVTYDRVPYFFSDQYDFGMECSGLPGMDDQVVFRGDPASREFLAFWLRHGQVAAGMNANIWDVTEPIQALIRSGAAVDPTRLADPDVPLEELAGSG